MGTNMKKYLLSATIAAASLFASAAIAADMPVRGAAPAPAVLPTWAGYYIGVHAGYAQHQTNHLDIPATFESALFTQRGAIAGGQIGYNWQRGSFVYGLEADGSWLSGSENVNSTFTVPGVFTGDDYTRMQWLATGRVRAGLAVDATLLYLTAGVAAGGVDNSRTFRVAGAVTGIQSEHKTKVGWVAGAGIEHMVATNWTARLEALYVDLGDSEATQFPLIAGSNNRFRFSDTASIVRLGLNYKFR